MTRAEVAATAKTFWVFTSGEDVFVPADHVLEIWESDRTILTAR